jgi:hypothetical protein
MSAQKIHLKDGTSIFASADDRVWLQLRVGSKSIEARKLGAIVRILSRLSSVGTSNVIHRTTPVRDVRGRGRRDDGFLLRLQSHGAQELTYLTSAP